MASAEEFAEAECCLVGSMIIDPERCIPFLVKKGVRDEWFENDQLGALFAGAVASYKNSGGRGVDAVTVFNEAKRICAAEKKEHREPPSFALVQECIDRTPTAAHVEYYAEIAKDHVMVQRSKEACQSFYAELRTGARTAIDNFREKLLDIVSVGVDEGQLAARDIDRVIGEFERAHQVRMVEGREYVRGIPMPWPHMTHLYGGLTAGLHIVSGRPSAGKTAIVNNMIRFWADHCGLAGGVNSMDMTPEAMWSRQICEGARVSLPKAGFGTTGDRDMARLREWGARCRKWPVEINRINDLDAFASWATVGVRRKGWKFVVVDFLQLFRFGGCERLCESDRTARISQTCKELSHSLDVPFVCLSQLNREVEKDSSGRPPKPSDLRGGGSLEQDAATVLMLARDEYVSQAWRDSSRWEEEGLCPTNLVPFGAKNYEMQRHLVAKIRPVWARLEKNQQGRVGAMPFVFYMNYLLFRMADWDAEELPIFNGANRQIGKHYGKFFQKIERDWRKNPEDDAFDQLGILIDPMDEEES